MSKAGRRKIAKAEGVKTTTNNSTIVDAKTGTTDEAKKDVVEVKKETKENTQSAQEEANVAEAAPAKETVENAETVKPKRKYTRRAATKTAEDKKTAAKTDKAAAKKAAKKEIENVEEVFIEFGEAQILTEDILNKIREAYKNEGHRISSIKKLQVYMNVDQKKAYYVINDKHEGKYVELF